MTQSYADVFLVLRSGARAKASDSGVNRWCSHVITNVLSSADNKSYLVAFLEQLAQASDPSREERLGLQVEPNLAGASIEEGDFAA